jgi:hypothetical protein
MRRFLTEILVFLTASAAIAICTAVVGARLTSPPTSAVVPIDLLSGSCVDEPFVPTQGTFIAALARLCFEQDSMRPRIELTGVAVGSLFTGWLTPAPPPGTTPREACSLADPGPSGSVPWPERFDAAIADQTGRVQLSAPLPGQRLKAGGRARLLVIDHGWVGVNQSEIRAADVAAWEDAWGLGPRLKSNDDRGRGRVVGCASFWLMGGVESLESVPPR